MTMSGVDPRVTIVVTQRERLGAMKEALDALYTSTRVPFELVYVVGRISGRRRRWLTSEAANRNFKLIEAGRPLTPAESRNLGLAEAHTEFVLFIENDVVPMEGWLEALIACANETGADAVVPLTCEGRPLHTIVHHIGGAEERAPGADSVEEGARDYSEVFHLQGQTREQAATRLLRRRTQTCEFHCVMTRRSVFSEIGSFDPVIVSKEHLDFSWRLARANFSMWVEPKAVVTFLIPSENDPVKLADLSYFLLRWSPAWQRRSHDSLKKSWGLVETGFISSRRKLANWRIVEHVVKPAVKRVPVLGRRWGFVERSARLIYPAAALAASILAWRYDTARNRSSGKGGQNASA